MKKNKIYNLFIENKWLVLIIVFAIAIRLFSFISLQPWEEDILKEKVIVNDAIGYNEIALTFLKDKSFENFGEFRTPGYPVFVASIYSITNNSVWMVLLIQIILNVSCVFIIYKFAISFFLKNIALLSAFIFAIDINNIYFSLTLLTDTLFVFLFLLFIYYLFKGIQKEKLSFLCISSLLLGLATLTRPISYFFSIVVVIYIVVFTILNLKNKFIYSAVFISIFFISISPWLIRNYSEYGEAKLSSITGFNLLFYNVASTESYKTQKKIEDVRAYFYDIAQKKGMDTTEKHSFKNSKIYSEISINYIKNNVILYAKRHLTGIAYMYVASPVGKIANIFNLETSNYRGNQKYSSEFSYSYILNKLSFPEWIILIIMSLYLLINYLFSFLGIILNTNKNNFKIIIFIVFVIGYFSILTGVVGGTRYKLPFMPFINILCSLGLYYFYNKLTSKHFKT